jgi:hypothetical protein
MRNAWLKNCKEGTMDKFVYTPDDDARVHEEGAIRLICKAFQSHEAGLPEWIKNSSDAYAREDAPEDKRVIVVIFTHGSKGFKARISCLDFCGMDGKTIEENFRIWADPEAAMRGGISKAVQGGHGNGGKCYMTQMFDDYAFIQTAKKGKGNRYGAAGGSIRLGYIPDRKEGRDFKIGSLKTGLEKVLQSVGCSIQALPPQAKQAMKIADGFTLCTGVGPKGYRSKIPVQALVTNLQQHPQMIRTLDLCKVYLVVNDELFNEGHEIVAPEIEPIKGTENGRVISIPEFLEDSQTGERISTTASGTLPAGEITLRTSEKNMRWGLKWRHNIVYRAQSGYVGFDAVTELDVQSPYRNQLYGECHLESLEAFKQNDRSRLAESPLTRSVRAFVGEQVQAYAKEFEVHDRRKRDQEERNALSKMNEALDSWKNRFLSELMHGLWGSGEDGLPRNGKKPLPSGKPARLELVLSHSKAGLGVAFRPRLRFFDKEGRHVRAVPFHWVSDDTNVAMVDEDLTIVNTFAVGRTEIYAETLDRKLRSNKVGLEVVHLREIQISPLELDVVAGSRQKLEAICRLSNGEETRDVFLVWTEANAKIAAVSSSGLVYGFAPGETQVVAGDDKCMSSEPAIIKVTTGQGRRTGDQHGTGYPRVLVSEVDLDPDTDETVVFSKDEPPVSQRPDDADRNIWWINSAAPLAKLYLDDSRGYGYKSSEWRVYHLERYIDIIFQIAVTNGPVEVKELSVNDWISQWGEKVTLIQAAAVSDLSDFIATGQFPEE